MPHVNRAAAAVLSWMAASVAFAHVPIRAAADAPVLVPGLLSLALVWYGVGLARLWGHVTARRELIARAAAFVAGWGVLAIALLSPLDVLASRSFAAHMVQHESLMLVAAPLLVIGRGLPTFLWALPHDQRRAVGLATRARVVRGPWAVIASPPGAWILHAAALWLWHVPALFNAALASEAVHDWQHTSFLLSALIFWHALLRHHARGARGVALVYLFTTTVHTGVLGALLTFARTPLYGGIDPGLSIDWGLSAMEDQQLGGLIMWVPGALVYVSAALFLLARWVGEGEAEGAAPVAQSPQR